MNNIESKEYEQYIINTISNLAKLFNDGLRKSISDIIQDSSIKIDINSLIKINIIAT